MSKDILFVDVGLLGTDAVWTCKQIPTFWRSILPPTAYITTKKTNSNIFTVMRTLNCKIINYLQTVIPVWIQITVMALTVNQLGENILFISKIL
jgi:hypothetical protein